MFGSVPGAFEKHLRKGSSHTLPEHGRGRTQSHVRGLVVPGFEGFEWMRDSLWADIKPL